MVKPIEPQGSSELADSSKALSRRASSANRQPSLLSRVTDIVLWLTIAGVLAVAFMPRDSGPNLGQIASAHTLPLVGETGNFEIPGKLERPLLVEAFASWCGACKRSNGTLEGLASARKAGVLDVIAVSVDDQAQDALLAKKSWPIRVDVAHDTDGSFSKNYNVGVLPTYILIGTDGRVHRVTAGVAGARDIRAWLNAEEPRNQRHGAERQGAESVR